ncbi:MAG: SpoIID/LytB domain-containing protein [Solirubrobacteraceae bacterium]
MKTRRGKRTRRGKGRVRARTKKAPAQPAQTLLIEGAGDGHGVGMSQWGALGFAEHGWTAAQILAHYYTGTSIGSVSQETIVKVLVGNRVERVPIEAYVRGVVAAEMPASWPAAALQAQAIASRTFALTDAAGGTRFNVYSDTRSQVYLGKAAETPQSNAAVKATAGEIVTYAGAPAITFFFASSGGQTESVQNVFGTPEPWLVAVPDPYDGGPLHHWTASVSFATAARQLHGYVKGGFEGIEVHERGISPRVLSAYVLGSAGKTEVSGADLEERLGLYSTWAYFSVRSPTGKVTREPDLSGSAPPAQATPQGQPSQAEPPQVESPAPPASTTSPAAGPSGGTSTSTVGGGAGAP